MKPTQRRKAEALYSELATARGSSAFDGNSQAGRVGGKLPCGEQGGSGCALEGGCGPRKLWAAVGSCGQLEVGHPRDSLGMHFWLPLVGPGLQQG